jgi:hypothetical protein
MPNDYYGPLLHTLMKYFFDRIPRLTGVRQAGKSLLVMKFDLFPGMIFVKD